MTEQNTTTQDQGTEQAQVEQAQAEANGTAEEANVARGPFEEQTAAEEAAQAAKAATGKAYKVWQTTKPDGSAVFTVAIDSARGLVAAAKGAGWKTSLVGGKAAKVISAADLSAWFNNLSDEEKAAWIAGHMPKQPAPEGDAPAKTKGRKGKGKAETEQQ